jgi:hypothetical protein
VARLTEHLGQEPTTTGTAAAEDDDVWTASARASEDNHAWCSTGPAGAPHEMSNAGGRLQEEGRLSGNGGGGGGGLRRRRQHGAGLHTLNAVAQIVQQ